MTETAVTVWDARKTALVKAHCGLEMSPFEFEAFVQFCLANGLNPLTGDIRPVRYGGKNPKVVYIVSITGHLKMAQRTGKYRGFAPPALIVRNKQSDELIEVPLPLYDEQRHVLVRAVARVLHADMPIPQEYTADMAYYKKDNEFWSGALAPNMLYKCAQAVALRRTFTDDASSSQMYSPEEMQQAEPIKVQTRVVKKQITEETAKQKWETIEAYLKKLRIKEDGIPYATMCTMEHFGVESVYDIEDVQALADYARKPLLERLREEGWFEDQAPAE